MELTIQHIELEGYLENYNLSLNFPAKSYAKREKSLKWIIVLNVNL